jgi:hypothetical protein
MTITNGYTDLATFKKYIRSYSTGSNALQLQQNLDDDSIAETIIESVSRDIDNLTGRQFFVSTGTYYFDQTDDREIFLDVDVLAVQSVINGDGRTVASSEYNLYPRNSNPKYSIKLKENSSVSWLSDSDGNTEGVIQITMVVGYANSVPTEIEDACLIMVKAEYNRRLGQNDSSNVIVTPNGTMLPSDGISKDALRKLQRYMKVGIGG